MNGKDSQDRSAPSIAGREPVGKIDEPDKTPGNGQSEPAKSSAEDASQTPVRSEITFKLDPESNHLIATLIPALDVGPVTLHSLKNSLKESGYADFYYDDGALILLVDRAGKAEKGSSIIGQKRDALLTVTIASNKQAAHIDISRCYGGEAMTLDKLKKVLEEQSVSSKCFLEEEIKQAVSKEQVTRLCVAKALMPEKGKDVVFEALVKEEEAQSLEEDEGGSVDYREVLDFLVVEAGTKLMRRVPPTKGVPGLNVLGEMIAPELGQDAKFSKEATEGAQLDPKDENLLIAALKGHPVIMPQGVKVDPTLTLKGVNIATGNIDFDGSVNVRGGINSGYEVKATGDVFVSDIVDKAKVTAGGNIVINGGVIGEEQDDDNAELKAQLRASGNISAKFVNLAKLTAAGDIVVRESVIHSKMQAKGEIRLGQEGGKGIIIGGISYALTGMVANVLGSDAYVSTTIKAGYGGKLRSQLETLKEEATRRDGERKQLLAILAKLLPEDVSRPLAGAVLEKTQKVNNAIKALDHKLEELGRGVVKINDQLSRIAASYVEVKKRLYPNVVISIDGVTETIDVERKMIKLVRQGKKLKAAV